MRLSIEELEQVKKKYGVNRLYSWSRINTYMTSPYEYFLQYIKHEKPLRDDSAYAPLGGVAHDLLEKYYSNEIHKQDMADSFDESWMENITFGDLKFNRSDDEKNESIKSKYYDNLLNYFNNFTPITYKTFLEKFVAIKIKDYVLQGYIDIMYKDNEDIVHIGDFKTSSMYRGEDLKHKSKQLMIYALGLHQMGIPFEKIKIEFNFLKYVNVEVSQKTKDKETGLYKTKVRKLERFDYVEKLSSSIIAWLKTIGIEGKEAQEILNNCIKENSLDSLPNEIKDKFKVTDCWTEAPFTENDINEIIDEIADTISEIEKLEKEYENTKDETLFWDSIDNIKKQEYYLSELCGYSISQHKPFGQYIDEKNMFNDNDKVSNDDDDDLSWLNELLE